MSLITTAVETAAAPIKAKLRLIVGTVVVALVLAVGAYVMMLRGEISSQNKKIGELNGQVAVLNANNTTLKGNITVLEGVNEVNGRTIAAFKEERLKSEAAIASLAKKDLANNKKIKDLNAYIDMLSQDPTKDGALAPVLTETLKAIKDRKEGAK